MPRTPATVRGLLAATRAADRDDDPDPELLRRFVGGDHGAFEVLVRRHAGLVWHVCRHVLGHDQDAEDAFQATFLVLARKSGAVRRAGSVAAFLHGVALRVALKARRAAARRPPIQRAVPGPGADAGAALREVQTILAEETDRLPAKLRGPFVLCVLEGAPRSDAARALGLKDGTLSTRVAEARLRLRERLTRRGVLFAAGVAALDLARAVPAAAAPDRLIRTTVTAAAAVGGRAGIAILPAAAVVILGVAGLGFGLASPPDPPPKEADRPAAAAPAAATDRHGDPLPAGAVTRLGTARLRHGQWVRSVAFSPDGREVASASFDGTVRVWDRATGRELRRLKGPFVEPHFVAYAAGGKHLLTAEGWYASRDPNPVRLWDAKTGEPIRTLVEQGPRSDTAAAISPDGRTLAYAVGDRVELVPCATGGRSGLVTNGGGRKVSLLAFSPDGTKLAVGSGGEFVGNAPPAEPFGVRLFDLARPAPADPIWRWRGEVMRGGSHSPAGTFSPDGTALLVALSSKQQPVLLDAATGAEVRKLSGPRVAVSPAFFLPGGGRVVTNTANGPATVWDVTTGTPVTEWPGERMDVLGGAALSPDGSTLAVAGHRAVRLWEAATGRPLPPAGEPAGDVNRFAFFPDGRRVLVGSYWDSESGGRVWDLVTGEQLISVPKAATAVALSPDGKTIVVAPYRGTLEVADAATGKVLRTVGGEPRSLDSLAFGLDGKLLIGIGWTDRSIRFWDAGTLKPLPALDAFPPGGGSRSVAVTAGGRTLVTAGLDGVVRVWDLAARKEVRRLTAGGLGDWKVAVSPDGRLAAVAATRERYGFGVSGPGVADPPAVIQLWDLDTGRRRFETAGPAGGVNCLAWSPDGRTVAAGDEAGVVRLYEMASRSMRAEVRGHEGPVRAVAFAPDGRRLLSGGSDTTVLVWDLLAGPAPAAADLSRLWDDLTGDAVAADRAARRLVLASDRAVELLAGKLRTEAADADKVKKLVAELDDPAFAVRERATAGLAELGAAAAPALRLALAGRPSAEVRERAEALLARLNRPLSGSSLRDARAVEVLERIGSPRGRAVLTGLAGGGDTLLARDAAAAAERLAGR